MPEVQITSAIAPNANGRLMIAIPTHKPDIPVKVMQSVIAARDTLIFKLGISVDVLTLVGNCHVDDARNDIVRTFLDSEADRLMWIDADVINSADALARLWQFDKDVIGGVYPYKNDDEGYPYRFDTKTGLKIEPDGTARVIGLPGGFTMVKRAVYDKLWKEAIDKFGGWMEKGSEGGNRYAKRPIAQVYYRSNVPFDEADRPGHFFARRLSGDYRFSEDAIAAGYELWIDPQLSLGHIGDKTWSGSLIRYELTKAGRWPMMINQRFSEIKRIDEVEARGDAVMLAMHTITDAFGNKPWACGPVLLATLFTIAQNPEIKTVLETGTGVSTAVLRYSGKRVRSLEADKVWGAKTEAFLESLGLDHAEVNPRNQISYAKITQRGNQKAPWYDFILGYTPDLLFIDGPRRDQPGMREAVLDHLPLNSPMPKVIVVDDVDDQDGMKLLQRLVTLGYSVETGMEPGRRAFAVAEYVGKELVDDMIGEGRIAAAE